MVQNQNANKLKKVNKTFKITLPLPEKTFGHKFKENIKNKIHSCVIVFGLSFSTLCMFRIMYISGLHNILQMYCHCNFISDAISILQLNVM